MPKKFKWKHVRFVLTHMLLAFLAILLVSLLIRSESTYSLGIFLAGYALLGLAEVKEEIGRLKERKEFENDLSTNLKVAYLTLKKPWVIIQSAVPAALATVALVQFTSL